MYTVTLNANLTSYLATADTLFEALGNLPLNSLELKTKSEIIVEKGGKKGVLNLTLMQGRALLRNHLRRQGYVYQLEALLK